MQRKPSVGYWIICVLALLWNLGGAYDYLMTVTQNADYFAKIPADMLAYYEALPQWLMWPWATAVWGGVLGWVLMLLRRRLALPVFIVSLVAMLINFAYWIPTGGFAVQPPAAVAFTIVIILGAIFAIWFARRSAAKGYLA